MSLTKCRTEPLRLAFRMLLLLLFSSVSRGQEGTEYSSYPVPLVLKHYGDMATYVAYTAKPNYTLEEPMAWLLYIPVSASNTSYIFDANTSYILVSYVFSNGLYDEGAIVWMANRQRPVSGKFSLTVNQASGTLVLRNGDGSVAWASSNPYPRWNGSVSMGLTATYSGMSPIGTLFLSDAMNTILWQSSDHPTHALTIPQFFKTAMSLISWASPSDPSEGLFSLVMEVGGLALYYNNSLPYWIWSIYGRNDIFGVTHTCRNLTEAYVMLRGNRAGTAVSRSLGLQVSSNLASPNLTSSDLCPADITTIYGQNAYFTGAGEAVDNAVTLLQVQPDGNLVAISSGMPWLTVYDLFAENQCLLPNYCGPYGLCTAPSNCQCLPSSDGSFPGTFPLHRSQGCPPIRPVSCSSTATVRFEFLIGVDYFANNYLVPVADLPTLDLCQAACLQNCSCLGAFWHAHTSACFHSSDMRGMQGSLNSSYMAFIKVEHLSKSKPDRRLIVGLVLGAAAFIILPIVIGIVVWRNCRANSKVGEDDEELFWQTVSGLPIRYSYKDLESITKGFGEKLGKGGSSTVYAGALQDETKVAVKCLDRFGQGKKEFQAEVVILGGVHHYNLVKLIGFCAEGSHRLLVYEYMANGSLDQWVSPKGRAPLEWKHRFRIALGAARGLAYLHGACKDTIVHLDIKPENILLDKDFEAKVSDFGLSTLMGRNETHKVTAMRGTPGYLAPEWFAEGSQICAKCDVFSFGKVLMEILGSRRNLEPSLQEEGLSQEEETDKTYFPSWLYLHTAHQGKEINVEHIAGVESLEENRQARVMLKTSFLCVLENPAQRPSMEMVVHMLEGRVPEVEDLDLTEIFQGLRFALGMPMPELAHRRIEEAIASLYQRLSLESTTSV